MDSRTHAVALADITYSSLATAFNLPLSHDPETLRRMWVLATPSRKEELSKATPAQKEARDRMALFPTAQGGHGGDANGNGGARSEVIFVAEDKWVPVVRLGGKVRRRQLTYHILVTMRQRRFCGGGLRKKLLTRYD